VARRFYVDSSAYLCVLLRQPGWRALADELNGQALLSSTLMILEVRRNLVRYAREGAVAPEHLQEALDQLVEDRASFHFRDLTIELCDDATMPVVTTPRSLDLAHLRTALWFHAQAPLTRFVTLDAPQALAARELGLPT
jgi:hypothetical protein